MSMVLFIGMIVIGLLWLGFLLGKESSNFVTKSKAWIVNQLTNSDQPKRESDNTVDTPSFLGKSKEITPPSSGTVKTELPPNSSVVDQPNTASSVPSNTSAGLESPGAIEQPQQPRTNHHPHNENVPLIGDRIVWKGLADQVGEQNDDDYHGSTTENSDDTDEQVSEMEDSLQNGYIEDSTLPIDEFNQDHANLFENFPLQESASFAEGVPLGEYLDKLERVNSVLDAVGRAAIRRLGRQSVVDRCNLFIEMVNEYGLLNDANVDGAIHQQEQNLIDYKDLFYQIAQESIQEEDQAFQDEEVTH